MTNMRNEIEELHETIRSEGYTHIIFDLDSTLTALDLNWDHWLDTMQSVLSDEIFIQLRNDLNRQTMTRPFGEIINSYIKDYGDNFYSPFLDASTHFESELRSHTPYYSLIALLHILKAEGITMSLWTNNLQLTAQKILTEMEVLPLFDTIIARDNVLFGKPDPEGWNLITDASCRVQDFLFVGDSSHDRLAAKSLGMNYFEIRYFHEP